MIEVPRTYQACFFADLIDFKPSVDTINPLLEAFRDRNLLPTTFQEVNVTVPVSPGGPPTSGVVQRLRLASADNEWSIDFDSNRIDIQKNAVDPTGSNLGTLEEFSRHSVDFLDRILSRFPKKGIRLSLVTNGLMGEMTEDRLCSIYAHIVNPLDFYVEHSPVAWNTRSVTRISIDVNGSDETVNVITNVDKTRGTFQGEEEPEPYDRIQVGFDINTYQVNKEPRFDVRHAEAFFLEALRIRDRILSLLEERLDG